MQPFSGRNRTWRAGALLAAALLAGAPAAASPSPVPLPPRHPAPPPAPASAELPADAAVPVPARRPPPPPPSRIVRAEDFETLRTAVGHLRQNRFDAALAERARLADPLARTLIDWLHVRDGSPHAGYERIAAFIREHPDWPHQQTLRTRLEVAAFDAAPDPRSLVALFTASPPLSGAGKAALAFAYLRLGDRASALAWVRDAWRDHTLSDAQEARILAEFGRDLTAADHKARLDRLLYRDHAASARRTAARLGKNAQALAEARAAVSGRTRTAARALDALPAAVRDDPVAQLTRIQHLRRAGEDMAAVRLMFAAPRDPAILVDVTQWWEERRILCRRMLDRGDPRAAYRLAAEHSASEGLAFAEAEFHAGWVALRYLGQPEIALRHFAALRDRVSTDISLSRAHYWLGRAHEARGDIPAARAAYEEAGRFDTVYYGQLARLKIGEAPVLSLPAPPGASEAERVNFSARPLVRAARLLRELGESRYAGSFLIELAYALDSHAEMALLGDLATAFALPNVAVQIGKIAATRNRPLPRLAFHTGGIPPYPRVGATVEPALVYAVARQESVFDPGAVSSAGARGLMQLMPATAQRTAKNFGQPYRGTGALTADPAYNAMLGAAHLGELIADFNGSYIMTIAGYNAGPGRVRQWIEAFGDPRAADVDPIDWIERIPFTETRNYVQRVLENLQVYRAALNGGEHPIRLAADLTRGR